MKIEELKKKRRIAIKSNSNHSLKKTPIEEMAQDKNARQYVIVKAIINETKDTKSFILIPDIKKGTKELAPFKAGEYISLKLFIDNNYYTRAYSLSSPPSLALKEYRITIKRVENGIVSNYMLDNVKVGDSLTISVPLGEFGYNKIRDEKNVIAVCGGSGITPFIALAYAVNEGMEDCNLTVFYSVKTYDDIILKKEIEDLNKNNNNKVKFVIILTRENKEGYLSGYISKEMVEPYLKEFNTVLMCGPKGLYQTMNLILKECNVPLKNVHYENFYLGYKPDIEETYELKVILKNDLVITSCKSNQSLLEAMESAGIKAPSMCRVGVCGYCRSILLSGKVKMIGKGLKDAELEHNYIHPCITYPASDITLRLDI